MSRREAILGDASLLELDDRRRGRSGRAHEVFGRLTEVHEYAPEERHFASNRAVHVPEPEREKHREERFLAHCGARVKKVIPKPKGFEFI